MRRLRIVVWIASLLLMPRAASAQQDLISTFAGGGPNNVLATAANVNYPVSTATDSANRFYIVSKNQERVFRVGFVNGTGTLTVIAGNGFSGYSGDGGPAPQAQLNLGAPSQIALDSSRNVYIADTNNCVVREVDHTTGNISIFAGAAGTCSYGGDGGAATSAQLNNPSGVAVDNSGNVFIADTDNYRIREVRGGIINTVAGNGTFCTGGGSACGDGGPATSARLSIVSGSMVVDSSGNVYFADLGNYSIRKFTVGGNINSVAGGRHCTGGGAACGDGGAATNAGLSEVYGLALDSSGNIFIPDFDNYEIRVVRGGIINTVAGNGTYCSTFPCGDGGAATSASLGYAYGVAVDGFENIFIPDYYNLRIRQVSAGGNINTVAGNGTLFSGENIPATDAFVAGPMRAASDSAGNVYISDLTDCVVRKVDTGGIITTFAGTVGTCSFTGDGGPATSATLNSPVGVAADSAGNVYIGDTGNRLIRKVDSGGTITTYAGNGACFDGDGIATMHGVCAAYGVAADSGGNVYIADPSDDLIRKIDTLSNLTTIAGNGTLVAGFSGDGGPATSATLNYPHDVAVDAAGNVYIADSDNLRVRKVDTGGIINTFAGNGAAGFQDDGVLATETSLNYPQGVGVDAAGDVLIADTMNNRIRWVDGQQGIIHTAAGNGSYGFGGDGGAVATSALLANPQGVGLDSQGNIYIADTNNNLVREVSALAGLTGGPTSVTFGVLPVGMTSPAEVVTLAVIGPLTINIGTTGDFSETDDCGSAPPSGTTCTVWVYFTPTSSGTRNGTVAITDNGFFNTSLTVKLQGTGTAVTVTPNLLAFGSEVVKGSVTKNVVVKNDGSNAIMIGNITPYSLSEKTDFSIATNTCPAAGQPLAGHATCTIGVAFNPQSTGAKKGALVIKDSDPTSPQVVGMTGKGADVVSLTPASVTFTKIQLVNTTSTASKITLKNTGTTPVVLAGSNAVVASAQFAIASGTTCVNSLSLSLNATCIINVTFTPTGIGTIAGTVTVTDSDPSSPQIVPLTGTATEVSVSPTTLAFGTVPSGTKTLFVTVTNKGTTALTFGTPTITGTGNAQFAVLPYSGPQSTCLSGNAVIQNGTCTINVQFSSTDTGTSYSETMSISDTGGASPQIVKITAKD